jgi:hypothetical protein
MTARAQFQAANVKKSGVNRYAEFKYFTLEDIIPVKTRIFYELGLLDIVSFDNDKNEARLYLFNADNTEEVPICFKSQLAPDESLIKNPIQKVGAIQTYVRRYLYLLALDIIESDGIEATTEKPDTASDEPDIIRPKKSNRPMSEGERKEIKEDLIDQGGEATETQIKAIKNGLKKLREKDADKYEPYVVASVKRLKGGLKKKEAEDLLIEIGNKIEEK